MKERNECLFVSIGRRSFDRIRESSLTLRDCECVYVCCETQNTRNNESESGRCSWKSFLLLTGWIGTGSREKDSITRSLSRRLSACVTLWCSFCLCSLSSSLTVHVSLSHVMSNRKCEQKRRPSFLSPFSPSLRYDCPVRKSNSLSDLWDRKECEWRVGGMRGTREKQSATAFGQLLPKTRIESFNPCLSYLLMLLSAATKLRLFASNATSSASGEKKRRKTLFLPNELRCVCVFRETFREKSRLIWWEERMKAREEKR